MGLFKFKKRSQKQEHLDSATQDLGVENTDLTLSLPFTKDFTSIANESSLMDDIMNELDSSTTGVSQFSSIVNGEAESPSSDYNTSSNSSFSIATPIIQSYSLHNLNQDLSGCRKNSMAMSNSVPDMKTLKENVIIYQNTLSSDDESESEEIIRRSVTFQSLPAKQVTAGQQKPNAALKPYDIANVQKDAMDRMRERHRRQTQKPIQMSPSLNFAFAQPAMPVRISMPPYGYPPMADTKPQRPIVQSRSFSKPQSPPNSGNMMRNTFSLNDIYNDATEKNGRKRSPSNNKTKRYSQVSSEFRFKRSISAYPSSQDQQVFHDVYQKQFELQQQQHQHQLFMQQLQHQRLQQQIEMQQQQLQEQQFIQQQQLHQLQQQQQIIHQALLDSTRRMMQNDSIGKKCHHSSKKPLYERKQQHRCKCQKKTQEEHADESTSNTVVEKSETELIQVPDKLCKELQRMKLGRSNYSLPDITLFSKEQDLNGDAWRTIKPFDASSPTNTL